MSKHFQKELDGLQKKMLSLCTIVEESLRDALKSVTDRNEQLAAHVIDGDTRIDTMEIEVEEECLKILALHQPVAVDLRVIVSILKINNDLERIGDLAVNIAERSLFLLRGETSPSIDFDFPTMFEQAICQLKCSLDSLINWDAAMARKVCAEDEILDGYNRNMLKIFRDQVTKTPEKIDVLLQYLSISRHLERIGDHATNIAEDVVYMIEGDIIRHRSAKRTYDSVKKRTM